MIQENRRHGFMVLALIFSLSSVFLLWHGCGGGGGGSDSGTTPPPTKSVFITGTVHGTVAIAYNKATGIEAARNVASGTPKTFSLNVAPGDYYLIFIENEDTANQTMYSFQNVTGGNVFTCKANTTLDLGIIDFDPVTKIAKPQTNPLSGNDNVTETVTPPADFSGAWILTFTFVNSTCPGQFPGKTETHPIFLTQDGINVTLTSPDIDDVLTGFATGNTINLWEFWQSPPYSALLTIDLTKQPDGSLAGAYSKVGYGGECSNSATLTAVRSSGLLPAPANIFAGYENASLNDNLAGIMANLVPTADAYRLYSSTDNVTFSQVSATFEQRDNAVGFFGIVVPQDTYFKIVAVKGGVEGLPSNAVFLNFTQKNSLPQFNIQSPTNDQTGVGLAPTFQWQAVPGAAGYVLGLHPMPDETQLIILELSGTSWTFGSSTNVITKYIEEFTALMPSTQYSLVVDAVDANGTVIADSDGIRFTTGSP